MITAILLFVLGLVIIVIGGNFMVDNASKISLITGIPQSLVGATIVSLATTLPELNVVIFSSLDGVNEMAVGNSVGSIIFNLTFIVGMLFIFSKNRIGHKSLGFNYYIMMFAVFIIYVFGIFDVMNRLAGMILLSIFLFFFINNIIDANKGGVEVETVSILLSKKRKKKPKLLTTIICFCLSSFFVSFGAKLLVSNGERIATLFNVSEHIIGVTIIAIGTSLPEVVTAITSIRKNSTNIAIGNTIGANILSCTLLLGISAIIEPGKLVMHRNIVNVALPLILVSSLVILLPMFWRKNCQKLQGGVLWLLFVVYYCTVIV